MILIQPMRELHGFGTHVGGIVLREARSIKDRPELVEVVVQVVMIKVHHRNVDAIPVRTPVQETR